MSDETLGPEWLFRICERMRHSMIHQEFERRNLSRASHPFLLFALGERGPGNPLSQAEIAEALGVSQPTAAVSIRRMEGAGLLRKVPDAEDRRLNRITLTAGGARLVRECKKAFGEIDRRMLEGFSDEDRETLRSFYLRMIRNLEAMGAQRPRQPEGRPAKGKGRSETC
ncbi:MAG TPA: MarR family transcriptional regulator [Spirochaetales bacterium]|nr:MarR family transcriptional regulator [Spirochaetales bacterium]HRY55967.1 MarR family transcriptional regulator [Spirochaetia bacterium]HRZ63913.1 MarR family transcriptional regulator [Spirochaetia bacterium]